MAFVQAVRRSLVPQFWNGFARCVATASHFEFLSDAALHAELSKCSSCEQKPCAAACPVACNPFDFIRVARSVGLPHDIQLAAAHILSMNPLGGTCGCVCPDKFCMSVCVRGDVDRPVDIPAVQATLVHRARQLGVLDQWPAPEKKTGKRVAVVGGGPSGLAAAAVLARAGHSVEIFEKMDRAGGNCNTIPDERLPKTVLTSDVEFVESLGDVAVHLNSPVADVGALAKKFDAVCVATGLQIHRTLNIPGLEKAHLAIPYLWDPAALSMHNKHVAVIGGGPVAVDVAHTAHLQGAKNVTVFYRRKMADMPLTDKERYSLFEVRADVIPHTVPTRIVTGPDGEVCGMVVKRSTDNSEHEYTDIDAVVFAIGNSADKSILPAELPENVFLAGDFAAGNGSTVVQNAAYGKRIGSDIDAYLTTGKSSARDAILPEDGRRCGVKLEGYAEEPVPLETDFFGRRIDSPFLLSASPVTDGYDQMVKAYEAGWTGGILKTAFDGVPIHIPNHYMCKFGENTYGNSDNVSGHALERVCEEIRRLVREYPDRLTMGSTGGPVTGNDEFDRDGWQSNTRKLEKAGAMGVEYSLSCPQGGDGTDGAIVSQNAALSAKIVDWVMSISDPEIPKLFKLTGAVTSIGPIIAAIKEVFLRYPGKKAGVTLANSFPAMIFRESPNPEDRWEKGIVMGMSGEGVTAISNLTLASAAHYDVHTSGNGGPFDYMQAANFLALGCKTVQFCTLPTKMGVRVISQLRRQMSHLLRAREMSSVAELIGSALPNPITDFMDLTPVKEISSVDPERCIHCGNCVDCPYLAITLNEDRIPEIDPAKCVSCGVCTQKCPGFALFLRPRTPEEAALTPE